MAIELPEQVSVMLDDLLKTINPDRITDILMAFVLALVGFVIARLVSKAFINTIGARFNPHQRLVWRRGIFYFIFILFLITSLREAGFKLSVFLGAAGILTVALGFASQTSASNLISGLFLIGEGFFEVGDMIQITLIRGHTLEGEVTSIDLLSVKLRTLDNVFIRLPNEQLIKAPVLNLTRYPIRRIPITLSITFQEDMAKVRHVLLSLAAEFPLVLDEPKPIVTVTAFRESTIELLFAVWTQQENFLQVRDEIQEMVKDGFSKNQIEMPVPTIGVYNTTPDEQHPLEAADLAMGPNPRHK